MYTHQRIVRWTGLIICCVAMLDVLWAGTGSGWECVPIDNSRRDNRGYVDSCVGKTGANCNGGLCVVYAQMDNGWYCWVCTRENCSCYSSTPVQVLWSRGYCTFDGGPDPCYCSYDELVWMPTTVSDCSS